MIRRVVVLCMLVPALVHAERPSGVCIDVSVDFVPTDSLQLVAWVERADGSFVDTLFITNKTGRFGLGNRPGRLDFNTGSANGDTFPYGRREQTFPVWAHRHGLSWPLVTFQNGDENNLSHPFSESSAEVPPPYCRPIQPTEPEFDSGTCASQAFTDKGVLSSAMSLYPPRMDVTRKAGVDSISVDMFRTLNPFDAVSQPTPLGGVSSKISWAAPQAIDYGDYVMFVEASKTYDFNGVYNATTYPSPAGIPWAEYGRPWRGQPSVIYRVPFSLTTLPTLASTDTYVGYGDITGQSGTINPPDATIETATPGSGASRFQLVSDGGTMYRMRVTATPEFDSTAPAKIGSPSVSKVGSTTATIAFTASGDDGDTGKVTGYEIRVRANSPMTADNFTESMAVTATVIPDSAGRPQSVELTGLLPQTDYFVGIRPYDNCFNKGELTVVEVTTLDREVAEVPWCFIATAAYGSVMANDVEMLRRFRDGVLTRTVIGELAVETYYTFGPAVAGVIGESELLRASARSVLEPIVAWARQLTY